MIAMKKILHRMALVGATAGMLAACAQEKGPAPILSVSKTNCLTELTLASAKPLALSAEETVPLELLVSSASPCLETSEGVRSLFELVQLPEHAQPFSVRMAAVPSSTGLFAPQLTLLDAEGLPVRQIPEEKFLFRGPKLTASTMIAGDERYLLIASNPEVVGDRTQRTSSVINQYQSGGPIYFTVRTGSEFTKSVTYSHGGNITVTAQTVDTSLDAK